MLDRYKNVLTILKHLAFAGGILIIITLVFFYYYLPSITNHDDTISVPNLEGRQLKDLENFLSSKKLRYEVEVDSGYSAKYPPLAVLKQFPLPNAKVKENRKIYVTLNGLTAPVVKVPDLYGQSLKNVMLQLKSLGLEVGNTEYVPRKFINTVVEMRYKGKKLKENDEVPKGSKLDFTLADGAGNREFPIPNLTGQDFEDAKVALLGMGLKVGDLFYEKEGYISVESVDQLGNTNTKKIKIEPGKIFKQKPDPENGSIRIGETVDLWVVEKDSVDIFDLEDLKETPEATEN